MAKIPVYAYENQNTLDQSLEAIRRQLAILQGAVLTRGSSQATLYAKVTTVVSDTEVKAEQQVWDSSLGTPAYADPTGTKILWNTTGFDAGDANTQPNIFTDTPLAVDDVIEVIFYVDKSNTSRWKARIGGGGAALFYIEITASTNISTYTGNIFDNPITRTAGAIAVTVRALQHDAGTIPNSAVSQGLWCIFDSVNDVYHAVNYSIFYGT